MYGIGAQAMLRKKKNRGGAPLQLDMQKLLKIYKILDESLYTLRKESKIY